MKVSKLSFSNRKIVEQIVPVKEFNEDNVNNKVNKNYGYVMPLFHGYKWAKTKTELIKQYIY